MITRRRARRWLCWLGVGVGSLAAAGMLFSCFAEIQWTMRAESITLRHMGIDANWANVARFPGVQVRAATGPWTFTILPWHDRFSGWALPLWAPLLLGAFAGYRLLPDAEKPGRCPTCAHDLGGAPRVEVQKEHVRCTECGTVCQRERPLDTEALGKRPS